MKKTLYIVLSLIVGLSTSCLAQDKASSKVLTRAGQTVKLASMGDTVSWVMGESLARSLENVHLNINKDVVRAAFNHTIDSLQQPIDEQTYKMVYDYINMLIMQQQMQQRKQQQAETAKAETEYFAQLEKKAGVKKSDVGFYYEVVKPGTGPLAQFAQRVKFDYRSFFMLSGEPFDQTYDVRESVVTTIGNQIIPGLREGMQLMQAGAIYRFYLPNNLAYGATGKEGVAPFTPMIYEVELHEILKD